MTMNAEVKTYGQMNKKADKVVVSSTPTSVKAIGPKYVTGTKADVPEGYAQVTLTAGDVWQDGSGYQMLLDEDAIAYGTIIPEQGGLTTSGDASAETYAEFEYKIPENADGALATTNIVMNSSVTILIPAGVYDWCITNPTPGDRMWIASSNGSIGGRYDDFEFVSGAAYEFVVSLGGQNDQVDLVIDDPTAPTIPTEVTANAVSADGTSAIISWVPGENNATWNLRWRPWVDPALMNKLWDFRTSFGTSHWMAMRHSSMRVGWFMTPMATATAGVLLTAAMLRTTFASTLQATLAVLALLLPTTGCSLQQ